MTATLQHAGEKKPEGFELRLSLLFGMLFIPNAVNLAYFPLWLRERGFSAVDIGILLSAPVFVRIIATPVITFYADRSSERAYAMVGITLASFLLSLLFFTNLMFAGVLALLCLVSAFWSPQVPLADSMALSGMRRYGVDYASIRVWGSACFFVVTIGGGSLVEHFGAPIVPFMLSAGFFLALIAAIFSPRVGKMRRLSDAGPLPVPAKSLRRPAVIALLLATGLIQGSHGYLYSFGSIYWKESGIGADMVGILWAVPVLSEIILFKAYRWIFGRASPQIVLLAAGGIAVFRWVFFLVAGAAGLGFWGFFVAQSLHAFSFGATYMAQQAYLAHAVPEEQAGSAQGLAVFVHGIIMSVTMLLSGPLYAQAHGKGFAVMTFIALAGILVGYKFAKLDSLERRLTP